MCGRFVATTDAEGLVRFFVVDERQTDDLPPSWNVAPTDRTYAVARHDGKRVLTAFRWGLVPFWAKDDKIGARMINARAETLEDRSAFAESFRRRRCLIPADGFYEWETSPDGRKLPHYVRRADGTPMAFAGLWASWRDRSQPDPERLLTSAIITTDANAAVRELHDRMPVIVEREHWDAWLAPDADPADLKPLLRPAAADTLTLRRVSTDVNNVRNNHPELLAGGGDMAGGGDTG